MVSKSRILANLGKAVDSATTGHFLAKGVDSNGIFETILYTDLVGTPTTLDSALTSQLIDSSYVQLRQTASGGGIDSAAVTTLIDSSYVAARSTAGSSGFVRYEYDTTANGTTFQDSDKTGQVLSYTEDYILVYYNGILMADTDYTATSGSSVVFSSGVDSGGIVSITKFSAASSGGGGASFNWGGDKAVVAGGQGAPTGYSMFSLLHSFNITTTGNASEAGYLTSPRKIANAAVSNGTRGVFMGGGTNGGNSTPVSNTMDYITIASHSGTATDFGDLNTGVSETCGASSNGTTGVVFGGQNSSDSTINEIQKITIATTGNASDFGDMTSTSRRGSAISNATYGVSHKGFTSVALDYVTIATPGNAADFGDLTSNMNGGGATSGACADASRGLFAGGYDVNEIEYITVSTPSNSTDFGDLTQARFNLTACSNSTRGVFCLGENNSNVAQNILDYVTIQTTGNATDFGDMTARTRAGGLSGAAA